MSSLPQPSYPSNVPDQAPNGMPLSPACQAKLNSFVDDYVDALLTDAGAAAGGQNMTQIDVPYLLQAQVFYQVGRVSFRRRLVNTISSALGAAALGAAAGALVTEDPLPSARILIALFACGIFLAPTLFTLIRYRSL